MSKENLANNYGLVLLGDAHGGCVFSYERAFCLHENVLFTHSRGGAFSYVNAGSVLRNAWWDYERLGTAHPKLGQIQPETQKSLSLCGVTS